jgi:hypothetical protein
MQNMAAALMAKVRIAHRQADHFRLLVNNTFGVEDVLVGGDLDLNDIVINMTFKTL